MTEAVDGRTIDDVLTRIRRPSRPCPGSWRPGAPSSPPTSARRGRPRPSRPPRSRTLAGWRPGTSSSPTSTSTRSRPTSRATRGIGAPALAPRLRTLPDPAAAAPGAARHQRPHQLRPAAGPARRHQRRGLHRPVLLDRRRRDHERIDGVLAARVAAEDDELSAQSAKSVLDRVLTPLNRAASTRFLREAAHEGVAQHHGAPAGARRRPGGVCRPARRSGGAECRSHRRPARAGQVLLRLASRVFGWCCPRRAESTCAVPRARWLRWTRPRPVRTGTPSRRGVALQASGARATNTPTGAAPSNHLIVRRAPLSFIYHPWDADTRDRPARCTGPWPQRLVIPSDAEERP